MTTNPIADLLGIKPAADKRALTIAGTQFELYPARNGCAEGLYRANPGYAVSNPCFSITPWQKDGKTALGQYLAKRDGVKRAEAEAIVDAARAELAAGTGRPDA